MDSTNKIFTDLEKYRPSHYEAPAPADSDDINNIADYYLNLSAKHRAMNRVYKPTSDPEPFEHPDYKPSR